MLTLSFRNIEDILAEKGEIVKTARNEGGSIEIENNQDNVSNSNVD